jgi:hypothetical protein
MTCFFVCNFYVVILLCDVWPWGGRWSKEDLDNGFKTPKPLKKSLKLLSKKKRAGRKRKSHQEEKKQKIRIEDVAREATLFDCNCKRACLAGVGDNVTESIDMLTEYMIPWFNMPSSEHRAKFFSILEGCASGVTAGGHLNKR